jgi:hypothetical protein
MLAPRSGRKYPAVRSNQRKGYAGKSDHEGTLMHTTERGLNAQIFERHFSPRTLSEIWGYSEDTIIRWFEDVPGVLKSGSDGTRGKRRKITLKIPESIATRVYQEHCK